MGLDEPEGEAAEVDDKEQVLGRIWLVCSPRPTARDGRALTFPHAQMGSIDGTVRCLHLCKKSYTVRTDDPGCRSIH